MQNQKICSKCKSSFACGPAPGTTQCWCEHLPHAAPLASDYDCFCPECLSQAINAAAERAIEATPLIEGEDYVIEGGMLVFTSSYHLRRGYCCGSGCRNCPYPQPVGGA